MPLINEQYYNFAHAKIITMRSVHLKLQINTLKKSILLLMMIFISQGVLFSQGIKTVTSSADSGDGSLRQIIADAVDGDIIMFDGTVKTITLDTTLTIGDKTLTIEGGGDIILERSLLFSDTFRIVTVMGTLDKVVTMKNLTIKNGYANNLKGGGLYANHFTAGQTILDGIIFKGNKSNREAGGAWIYGNSTENASIVTNCKFIGNETFLAVNYFGDLDGDAGGLYAVNTEISTCTFTDNEAVDDGGAFWLGAGVTVDNVVATGNIAADVGGASRINDQSVVITNTTFESNYSAGSAGALFLARGTVTNCEFINNTAATKSGGAVHANQNECYIRDCLFDGNTAGSIGGGLYMDDGGFMKNCVITNNTAGKNGGGVYMAGKKASALLSGCIITNNSADSIGGGAYLAISDVVNTTIVGNHAAKNGGALAGDGEWFLANTILYDNDAAGADKNIQVVSNSSTTDARNCAIDVAGYNSSAWTANNITTLDASPFIGGTGVDSLMLPPGSDLLDAGDITDIESLVTENDLNGVKRIINGTIDLGAYERYVSLIVTNANNSGPGSLRQIIANAADGDNVITFADGISTIKIDQPLELGDISVMIDGGGDIILDGAFNGDPTLDIYRVFTITGDLNKTVTIKNLTIRNGFAEGADGGGLFADHAATGGKTIIENVVFNNNVASLTGGAAYISGWSKDVCKIIDCDFTSNMASDGATMGDGGAVKAFFTEISGSTFTGNEANNDAGAVFAGDSVMIYNSVFTGNIARHEAGAIRMQDARAKVSNCTIESNESGSDGGAVFLAYGKITHSEFINNSSGGFGGAIYINNNNNIIADCLIKGNHASAAGGASRGGGGVCLDDGSIISNCIITDNTSDNHGGGVYIRGDISTGYIVGCVIANNTAIAQGGGLYIDLAGEVINCAITQNYAGINGGALTGLSGPWFIANSVVENNDAAGTDKNIEFIANSATLHASNCGIDATAYNDASWTATNITTLNDSPFVGGSETDSLHFIIGSPLIDGGTLNYGIADLLPEMDIDGNMRIQSNLDIGPYESENIFVEAVTLDKTSIEIVPGETETIIATVIPEFADNPKVTWSSSDESVATVDGGVVTAVAAGSASITATSEDGGLKATCNVLVAISVTGVTLDQSSISINIGNTATLSATLIPENATERTIGWDSDNEAVATVDNGVVTAISAGTSTISVVTMDGFFIATCDVTVISPVTSVSLDQVDLDLVPEENATLVATVAPAGASNPSVIWSSSNETVATVANGEVTAVANGEAVITVTTVDGGFIATCSVTVATPVTGVSLDKATLDLEKGGTATLTATVTPEDATDPSVSWSSSEEAVATVAGGVITAVSKGEAVITATTVEGGFTATCNVTVTTPVTGVSLDQDTLELEPGESAILLASVTPADASDPTVSWSSSSDNVATVTDGVVNALANGIATITVTTADGGITATCDVTVKTSVTGVSLDHTSLELEKGENAALAATITPSEATDQSVSWSSSDETIATVANGVVTAVANGKATITVTTTDGGITATCEVTVYTSVTGISLDQASIELEPGGTATLIAAVAPSDATETTVRWSSSDEAVATVSDGLVTAIADGTAIIIASSTDGGYKAACNVTVKTVGVDSYSTIGFKMYPNPANEILNIELGNLSGYAHISIFNLTGKAIHNSIQINSKFDINTSAFEPGLYFIKINTGNENTMQRFSVQH